MMDILHESLQNNHDMQNASYPSSMLHSGRGLDGFHIVAGLPPPALTSCMESVAACSEQMQLFRYHPEVKFNLVARNPMISKQKAYKEIVPPHLASWVASDMSRFVKAKHNGVSW
jgi:hypothetical protein